jgi:hypothetical protein
VYLRVEDILRAVDIFGGFPLTNDRQQLDLDPSTQYLIEMRRAFEHREKLASVDPHVDRYVIIASDANFNRL